MVARVYTYITRDFVSHPSEGLTIAGINSLFSEKASAINRLISRLRERGYNMENMVLEQITDITQVTKVLNSNIDMLNKYMSALNVAYSTNYLLPKEVLETMKIELINDDTVGSVTVRDESIEVAMNNGQIVTVNTASVSSVKDGVTKTITHD